MEVRIYTQGHMEQQLMIQSPIFRHEKAKKNCNNRIPNFKRFFEGKKAFLLLMFFVTFELLKISM